MNYDKDLEKSWGDISEIVEQYLYNDLPATFDGYLIEIGKRNLLYLLGDVLQYMTTEHWMYVEMGRIMGQKHLDLIRPDLFDTFKQTSDFINVIIRSKNRRLIDKLRFIENHHFNLIAATGGYAFYKVFCSSSMIDFISDMMPNTFYPLMLHPDYPRIKHLLLYEALTGRNLKLAMFILKPYKVELDKWVVKCLPLPDSLENLLIKEISKTINVRSITMNFLCDSAIKYGMFPVALAINNSTTLTTLQNPQHVCSYLSCMIANNEVEYVRELVKYNYKCNNTAFLCDGIDNTTSIEIIKLVDFDRIFHVRVKLYKIGKIMIDDVDAFSIEDLPALLDPNLKCSDKFKIALAERISYPTFHPLARRNKYTKHVRRLLA